MDFTAALSILLSDGGLREAYLRDPEKTAQTLAIDDCDLVPFVTLDPCVLEIQAQLLLSKRFLEVREIIPLT